MYNVEECTPLSGRKLGRIWLISVICDHHYASTVDANGMGRRGTRAWSTLNQRLIALIIIRVRAYQLSVEEVC